MLLVRILTVAFWGSLVNATVSIGTEESDKNGRGNTPPRRLSLTTAIPSAAINHRPPSTSPLKKTSGLKNGSQMKPQLSDAKRLQDLMDETSLLKAQLEALQMKDWDQTAERVALFNEREKALQVIELQEKILEEAKVDKETLKLQHQLIDALEFAIVKLKESYDAKQAEVDALKEKLSNYEKPGH
ncbi:MAG: hypothetical protein K2Y18_04565 [Alphaproteobacteria bacterium]|jgi:hypothetical protein|nr:hypothetical protein [Alphaproteobacteria bacterium]